MRASRSLRDSVGFTLVEVMMAILVLMVGVLGVLAMLDGANARTNANKAREGATALAREVVEAARSLPYARLTPTSVTSLLQAQPGLGDSGSGSGWTIQQRNFTYTITASECALDDPADGVGTHDSSFCSDTATTSSKPPDNEPQDYKRVTVDVSWTKPGTARHDIKQTTLIDNPGDAAGPSVTGLAVKLGGPVLPVTSTNVTSIPFTATTSDVPAAVNWSLDGAIQNPAPTGSGTSWDFTWQLGNVTATSYSPGAVLDGVYTVGAQAFDDQGASAGIRSLTVRLNRVTPIAPVGFAGGWNGSRIDFEWQPNAEGDILGYRIYRIDSSGRTLVWPSSATKLVTDASGQDANPPNVPTLQYQVVALDTDPTTGQPREGTASSTLTVNQGNQPPNPPTNLVATSQGNATTLTWTAPATPDPDGEPVAFYRIYRDGTAYADRYDRTNTGSTTTFTDTNTGGVQHSYWVVAVDPGLAESAYLGPVTQ